MTPFPPGPFSIIYADPGWNYRDKALAGNRGAECKYTCSTDEEIMALPVESIAANNAWLFLWITMPKLPLAEKVINSWGFTYKTCAFNWIKKNKKSNTLFWGMGKYSRANPELCLLGTRGRVVRQRADVHSVVISSVGEHSRKPTEVRDRILKLCGDLPRIELFAREAVPGWSRWGDGK